MVVLEGHNMLGVNNPNQYLQPDYLSPLPTTLDSKKSPLALLVQTCSQIGADPPNSSKSILHPSPLSSNDSNSSLSSSSSSGAQKRKASTDSGHGMSLKSHSSDSSSNDSGRPRSSGSTSSTCSAAKQPRLSHSTSPLSHHIMVNGKVSPSNKYSSANSNNNNNESSSLISHSSKIRKLSGQSISSECSDKSRNLPSRSSPPTSHSASVVVPQGKHSSGSSSASHGTRSPHGQQQHHEKSTKSETSSSSTKSSSHSSPKPSSHQHDQGASPIIRSGLDVLQGKDLPKFGAFGAYPGFDPTNPAFRLPFLAAHHANLLAGYPPGAMPTHPAQYAALYGAGMKPKENPICRDPYCTGCQFSGGPSVSSAPSSSSFVCPAGCASCDHPKFPLLHPPAAGGSTGSPYPSIPGFPPGMSHAALSALGATYPPSVLSHSHHAAAAAALIQQQAMATLASHQQTSATTKPYVCNWNSEKGYCGVRFQNSEDLLVHLRQHTSSSSNSSSSTSVDNASSSAVGAPFAAGHPGIPHPPTSTAASIYSAAMAAAMHRAYPTPPPASPYLSALAAAGGKALGPIPPPPPALAGYYSSPYSLYGPRIG